MCTVTFLPLGDDNFILTSNRDEDPKRRTIAPQKYSQDGAIIIYPKDDVAGGTWIGLSDQKRMVCLLNGGFTLHKKNEFYKFSRGIVVKRILALPVDEAIEFIRNFDFFDIEPFTLILISWHEGLKVCEFVWDGKERHLFTELEDRPRIWSSATLYNGNDKRLRRQWFSNWLNTNPEFTQENIIKLHQRQDLGLPEKTFKMKREHIETVNTTSYKKIGNEISVIYIDYLNQTETCLSDTL